MKCQKCDKQAVFHITELESGAVRELHFCEDHARAYLNQAEGAPAGPPEIESGAGATAGVPGVAQTAEDLAVLDQKSCEMCGITFFEFRNQGRLGCAHDYVVFAKELEPLIANVHGSTEHAGRRPSWALTAAEPTAGPAGVAPGSPEHGTEELTGIIGLRRGMRQAIATEDYEKAREHRDAIKGIEERRIPPAGQS